MRGARPLLEGDAEQQPRAHLGGDRRRQVVGDGDRRDGRQLEPVAGHQPGEPCPDVADIGGPRGQLRRRPVPQGFAPRRRRHRGSRPREAIPRRAGGCSPRAGSGPWPSVPGRRRSRPRRARPARAETVRQPLQLPCGTFRERPQLVRREGRGWPGRALRQMRDVAPGRPDGDPGRRGDPGQPRHPGSGSPRPSWIRAASRAIASFGVVAVGRHPDPIALPDPEPQHGQDAARIGLGAITAQVRDPDRRTGSRQQPERTSRPSGRGGPTGCRSRARWTARRERTRRKQNEGGTPLPALLPRGSRGLRAQVLDDHVLAALDRCVVRLCGRELAADHLGDRPR